MEITSDSIKEQSLMAVDYKEASLADLEARATELRGELGELDADSTDFADQVRSLATEAEAVDTAMTLIDLEERRARANLVATGSGIRRPTNGRGVELRSIGESVVTEELVDWVMKGHTDTWESNYSDQGSLDQMFRAADEILTRAGIGEWGVSGPPGYDASGAGNLLPVGQPIAPIPRQARLYLRDLIPTMTTTLARIPYVQELNPTANESATAVAEGGNKPNASINFVGANADPTVLAATLVISKQLFEDAQAVVQYINTRLPYLVKFKEDAEILNGSGTWPDMTGILETGGVLSQAAIAGEIAQTLGSAFAKVENQDGTPTAVVLNPTNAWSMFTKRAAGGSGTFDAGTPFSALPLTVWGVPTYRTRAMAVNTALVGDFQLGAMIADRESVNIQTYRERYAEQNQILMVCEERIGLMVFRPDLFCSVAFS